jgi:hypothetical protein
MTPNSPTVTLSSEEKILAILDPGAVFKDPRAEGREWLEDYRERKRKEEVNGTNENDG